MSRGFFPVNKVSGGLFTGVVSGRTVWLFANETEVVSMAMAPLNGGEVQGVNVHCIWIMSWMRGLRVMGSIGLWSLWSRSSMDKGDLLSDFFLKAKMSGLSIPASDGGGDGVHSLDMLHDPDQDPS